MNNRLRDWLNSAEPWLAEALAIVGAFVFFLQARLYAFTQLSVLDEGAYLVKGYWFATGRYTPYQDFGPLTNHMPLSFLIPGYVQAWFGPGLRTGRIFAVAVALVFLLGLYLVSKRLGGRGWAAALLWAVAVNPAMIKVYSVGVSQGLVAAMLVWTLWLALGADRKLGHILGAAALAAAMALTRLNMTPVLFLLLLFIFWQHGRRAGLYASALGLGIWALGHALFWPGILQMWANYTPAWLTPFLDTWRDPAAGLESWRSGTALHGRWIAFLEGLRFNFLPVAAALAAALLWPRPGGWSDQARRKIAVFLAALFSLLFLMHAAVTLGGEYCVFCFPLYITFFSALPFFLLIVVWPDRATEGRSRWAAASLVVLLALASYGAYTLYSGAFPPAGWARGIALMDVPRLRGGQLQAGTVPLWGLLEGRLGWPYEQSIETISAILGFGIFTLGGALLGALALWLANRRRDEQPLRRTVLALLVAGALLSPTPLLGGGDHSYDCGENVVAAYERLGAELDQRIEDGALVFWRGGRSAVPLLYLSDIGAFPAQINGDYTYRLGGNPAELERYGLWNETLLKRWLRQADVILVEEDLLRTWIADALQAPGFDEEVPTAPLAACSPRSAIAIYRYQP